MTRVLSLRGAHKSFAQRGAEPVTALRNIDLDVDAGTSMAIVGRSGSGKSTLLSVLGLFENLDLGRFAFDGSETRGMTDRSLSTLRGQHLGFIFQRFFLLDHLTARQNVVLALTHGRVPGRRRELTMDALDQVGLADKATRRPRELSGGEQQRVAIARALVKTPQVVLADEPTGALDEETGDTIVNLLLSAARDRGATVVAVTHDPVVAGQFDQSRRLTAGRWEAES